VSRPALGPTQPPNQREPGPLTLGIKRPEREVHHSHTSGAENHYVGKLYYIHVNGMVFRHSGIVPLPQLHWLTQKKADAQSWYCILKARYNLTPNFLSRLL
jgi:hypothetical protein